MTLAYSTPGGLSKAWRVYAGTAAGQWLVLIAGWPFYRAVVNDFGDLVPVAWL